MTIPTLVERITEAKNELKYRSDGRSHKLFLLLTDCRIALAPKLPSHTEPGTSPIGYEPSGDRRSVVEPGEIEQLYRDSIGIVRGRINKGFAKHQSTYLGSKEHKEYFVLERALIVLHDELGRERKENKFLLEAIEAAVADTKYFEAKYNELAKDVRRTNI